MIRRVQGIVHGKTIEIEEELGLADDWTEEDDKILEEIYRSRHSDSRPEIR